MNFTDNLACVCLFACMPFVVACMLCDQVIKRGASGRLCVCECVSVCVSLSVCMCTCMRAFACACTCVCMCMYA